MLNALDRVSIGHILIGQKRRLNIFLNQTKIDTWRSFTSNIRIGHLPSPQILIKISIFTVRPMTLMQMPFPSLVSSLNRLKCHCYFPRPRCCAQCSNFPFFVVLPYNLFDLLLRKTANILISALAEFLADENRMQTAICIKAKVWIQLMFPSLW